MSDHIRIVNKKVGQTPLECINEIKKAEPNLSHLPLTYAGRLDPLAEGVLVILIGDECLKKDEYLKLGKVYEVEVLFGFATDTYDVMGKIINLDLVPLRAELNTSFGEDLHKILPQFTGRIKQSYPPYSSRTVDGKPLYQWAREGKLNEITIPSHDVFVEKIEIIKEDIISGDKLLKKIQKDISRVGGDFRQKEIINIWQDTLKEKKEENYKTITLRISCGSGVYVRGIAHEIGQALGISSLALHIKRTKVGEYEI
jgi:tRNA pseudouridine55 synthase